jgi:hypothetical protein
MLIGKDNGNGKTFQRLKASYLSTQAGFYQDTNYWICGPETSRGHSYQLIRKCYYVHASSWNAKIDN